MHDQQNIKFVLSFVRLYRNIISSEKLYHYCIQTVWCDNRQYSACCYSHLP